MKVNRVNAEGLATVSVGSPLWNEAQESKPNEPYNGEWEYAGIKFFGIEDGNHIWKHVWRTKSGATLFKLYEGHWQFRICRNTRCRALTSRRSSKDRDDPLCKDCEISTLDCWPCTERRVLEDTRRGKAEFHLTKREMNLILFALTTANKEAVPYLGDDIGVEANEIEILRAKFMENDNEVQS